MLQRVKVRAGLAAAAERTGVFIVCVGARQVFNGSLAAVKRDLAPHELSR